MIQLNENELLRHELINLKVKVIRSSNHLQEGITGKVIDETKNMLIISDHSKKKSIFKKDATYVFNTSDGKCIELQGNLLLSRPADRIGRRFRRKKS